MIIVSVSTKKYRKKAGKRAKRHTFLYYFDENNRFCCRRISKIAGIYYKLFQKKKVRFTCPKCKRVFSAYGQKKNKVICPYCE